MIPKTLTLLIMLLTATMAASRFTGFPAQAQVTGGNISPPYFPSDFPTARMSVPPYVAYPYSIISGTSGTPYLLEGNPAPVNVRFATNYYAYNFTGTGNVTLTASSDAFVEDGSLTMYIDSSSTFTFTLTPTIKSGLEGTYTVLYIATNELSNQIAQQSSSITVWSAVHGEASDSLFTASVMLSNPQGGGLISMGGTRYQTSGGGANFTLASYEYAQATLAYNNRDWNGTRTHAQNATDLINKANAAEAASSLPDRTAFLVQVATYPLLIIAVLVMIYIVAATFRKIYPSTRPAKTT